MQRMSASSPIDVLLQDAPGGIQKGLLARHLGSQRTRASAKTRHLYARSTQYPPVQSGRKPILCKKVLPAGFCKASRILDREPQSDCVNRKPHHNRRFEMRPRMLMPLHADSRYPAVMAQREQNVQRMRRTAATLGGS